MKKKSPKANFVERELLGLIARQRLAVGDLIPSENGLASLLGVSRSTVRQAISLLEDEGILRGEQGCGTFLVRMPKIPKLDVTPPKFIAYVCDGGIDNPFMASIARGIEEGMVGNGMQLCVRSTTGGVEHEAEIIRELLASGIAGIIVSLVETNPPSSFIKELCRSGAKVVVTNDIPGLNAPATASDNREGAFIATNALTEAGHKRIAHIMGPAKVRESNVKLEACRRALEEAGIEFDPRLVAAPTSAFDAFSVELGRAGMEKLLALPEAQWPTAVFAANDELAVGAWEVLRERGLSVPEDMSLIGFGNLSLPYGRGFMLSTVEEHPRDIGIAAWNLLKRLFDGDLSARYSRVLLRPELVARASVAPPKQRAQEA